jgi:DNA-binding XRE family transcriptional regulator
MLERTRKHHTKHIEARFAGTPDRIRRLRELAKEAGVEDITDTFSIEEVFPEVLTNKGGVVLRGSRYKDDMTQEQLSKITGIPRPHISGMERGARPIGKETAKKLAAAFNCDYRLFL